MTPRHAILLLLLVWAALWGWSVAALWLVQPTGDGFTRGLNRVTTFLGWQIGAGAVAVILFALRVHATGPLRRLLWLPLVLALTLTALIAGVLAWSWTQHLIWAPTPEPPPGPPTKPAG